MDQGLRPSSFRGSESESTGDVIGKWNAAVAAEAQAIKESRDPKRERERQLAQRTAGKAGADEALKKAGVTPEDFWTSEEGLTKTSFTERTGKKIDIPEEAQVGAMSREMETPEGGLVRQAVGPYGFASVKYTPEGAAKLAQQRATEEDRAIRYGTALAEAKKIGKQRELERGEKVAAKFAKWEADREALAEGKAIQAESRKRLSRINRALRQDARYRQKWERGAGDTAPMSAEQYMAYMDEKAKLEADVAAREGLGEKNKKITKLGYDARAERAKQIVERNRLRQAALEAAESYAAQTRSAQAQAQAQASSPFISATEDYFKTIYGDTDFGYGLFGSGKKESEK